MKIKHEIKQKVARNKTTIIMLEKNKKQNKTKSRKEYNYNNA